MLPETKKAQEIIELAIKLRKCAETGAGITLTVPTGEEISMDDTMLWYYALGLLSAAHALSSDGSKITVDFGEFDPDKSEESKHIHRSDKVH